MPVPNGKGPEPKWLHIDDFSPGCMDSSNISTVSPRTGRVPGAADIGGTFACSVISGGSLGPLPAIVHSEPYSSFSGLPGVSTVSLVAGFIVTPQLDSGNYEVVAIFESDDGINHYVKAYSFVPGVGLNPIVGPSITSGTVAGFFGAPYPAFTRLNAAGTPGPPPPSPKLVFPTAVSTDTRGPDGHLWVYPSVAAPTTFVADDLITGVAGTPPSSITGQVVCYGNRIICLVGVNYGWPAGGGINVNENFNYTDPPESTVYGNQQSIDAIETPWGYGAWGTMSVGELILIKKYGGAVLLNGDINVPSSIIRIPGVQSTGDLVGRACSTPNGLVYCSQNQGAWIWNGGSSAYKMSQNIRDDFFDLETNNLASNNYGFFVEHWQKWIMFSGNVWYDTDTNSWWNIYPKRGTTIGTLVGKDMWWYCLTQNGNQMLAAPLQIHASGDPAYNVLDNTVASSQYQWKSLPIHVTPNADRVIDIRQIIVRCSDPSNSGAATVNVTCPNSGWAGSTSNPATEPIGVDPTILRFNVGLGVQVADIVLQLLVTNSAGNPAPIIESIDIEYKVRQSEAVAN